ncbi:MAG TPA: hypothetical protein PK971_12065 [Saprospiraceae bacterium]|nr:hypothetical protein [Saprospiraceae bacterium]
MTHRPSLWQSLLLLALGAAALYWHGNEDLWNDEIYTLRNFVFKGLPTVLSDYHVPNNHVLANVLHWGWASLTGADFGDCLDAAWRIRLLPVLLSLGTVLVLMRTAERQWGAGFAAGLALLSGISFQAFAFQVRGYPLTLLAASGLLYYALRVLKENSLLWKNMVAAAALTAALLWAMPSNLYFVLVVAAAVPLAAWAGGRAGHMRPACYFAAAMAAGVGCAVLLYAPLWGQMLSNKYFQAGQPFQMAHWENSERTLRHWVSWRWLLLPVVLWGCWKALTDRGLARSQGLLLAGALFLPFFISAARGDAAPMRSYLVQLPAFVLLAALGWAEALRSLPHRARLLGGLGLGLCVLGYGYSVYELRQRLDQGLHDGWRYQDLNYNYYQHYYAPNREYDFFQKYWGQKVLIVENSEPHDMPVYVQHRGIRTAPIDSMLRAAQPGDTLFFSTRDGQRLVEGMKAEWDCWCLQPAQRYPRVVACKKR